MPKCFACDRKLGSNPYIADTRDGQIVYIGSECYQLVRKAGEAGYRPPKGGPRLWPIAKGLDQATLALYHVSARQYARSHS